MDWRDDFKAANKDRTFDAYGRELTAPKDSTPGNTTYSESLVAKSTGSKAKAFFEENSASSVFAPRAVLTDQPQVHMLNSASMKEEEAEEKENSEPPVAAETSTKPEQELPIEEKLRKEYGDPTEDAPVLAQADAPKPMQAMMMALQSNKRELALKYARQYVRYMREVNDRVKLVDSMQRLARVSEGELPEKFIESEEPDYEGLRALYEKEKQGDAEKKASAGSYAMSLNGDAKSLLLEAEADEDKRVLKSRDTTAAKTSPEVQVLDEKTERARIRAAYANQIPRDAAGKVTLFFFFRPTDGPSLLMLSEIEKLYKQHRDNPDIVVRGLSLDPLDSNTFKLLSRQLELTYPLASGSGAAKQLGVSISPTTVLLAPSSDRVWLDVGIRKWFQIDELLLMMRGR